MINRSVRGTTRCKRMADITDGQSYTILGGEKSFDRNVQSGPTWYWDEPYFLGGSAGTARDGIGIMPDGTGIAFRNNWGSSHPAIAQFVMADGSVRGLTFALVSLDLAALLTPGRGEDAR